MGTINSAERELEQAGFIVRNAGINGERNGDRLNGVITWAAGINLAPLVNRFAELKAVNRRSFRLHEFITVEQNC